jgi:putative flippase GtrA
MPIQTYRYAVCGGGNAVLGTLVFLMTFEYLLADYQQVDLGFYAIKSYNVALLSSFLVTFCVGFLLNKYVVFTSSNLRGRIQLFRYFLAVLFNLLLQYVLMKILVEAFRIYPIAAQLITTGIAIAVSYLTQHHFSFRVKPVK